MVCFLLSLVMSLFRAAGTPEDNPHLYYRAEDLIVGSTIHVLGRDLLIRACDPFTRTFYKEHFGIMQPAPLEAEEPEERKAEVRLTKLQLAFRFEGYVCVDVPSCLLRALVRPLLIS